MTAPPRPLFTKEISFGQVIQIAVLLIGLGGAYTMLKQQAEANAAAVSVINTELTAMELRLRTLENQTARADERYNSIINYLTRIDERLERIEGRR